MSRGTSGSDSVAPVSDTCKCHMTHVPLRSTLMHRLSAWRGVQKKKKKNLPENEKPDEAGGGNGAIPVFSPTVRP